MAKLVNFNGKNDDNSKDEIKNIDDIETEEEAYVNPFSERLNQELEEIIDGVNIVIPTIQED